MARYHFFTLDVFTGRQFGGKQMQAIATSALAGYLCDLEGRDGLSVLLSEGWINLN